MRPVGFNPHSDLQARSHPENERVDANSDTVFNFDRVARRSFRSGEQARDESISDG